MPRKNYAPPEFKSYTLDEVRERLEDHGVSVAAFARLVGVAQPHMWHVLKGQRGVSSLMRIRIAEVMGMLEKALNNRKAWSRESAPCEDDEPAPSAVRNRQSRVHTLVLVDAAIWRI